jgi:hypothetical protein
MATKIYRPVGRQRYDDPLYDLFPADQPPASPSAYDDEFDDGTISSAWAWRNQGSCTIAEASGRQQLYAPSAAGNSLHIREIAAPSGDFTATLKLGGGGNIAAGVLRYGLCVINNTNGKIVMGSHVFGGASQLGRLQRWTNPTTFSTDLVLATYGTDIAIPTWYARIRIAGTTISYHVSYDGISFFQYGTEAIASFIGTVRADVDRVGFFLANEGSGQDAYLNAHWLRVT